MNGSKNFGLLILILALSLFFTACSSGGGSGENPPQILQLKGTAAEGVPISNATVFFKDSQGVTDSVSTDSNGKYIKGLQMTLPVLIKVTTNSKTYYSIATQEGTTNIHPFTDLIIRNWYKVKGKNIDEIFSSQGLPSLMPQKQEIDTIEAVVREILSDFLISAGMDPNSFNLINTPFDANRQGFDKILDILKIQYDQNGNANIVPVDTSQNTTGKPIATLTSDTDLSVLAEAKEEINGILENLISIMNQEKCNLTANHIKSYFDPNFFHQGMDLNKFTQALTGDCPDRWINRESWELVDIDTYDSANETLSGMTMVKLRDNNNYIIWAKIPMYFKKINSQWKVTGDGIIAGIRLRVTYEKVYKPDNTTQFRKSLWVDVYDRADKVASVELSGPGLAQPIPIPLSCERPNFTNYCEDDLSIREFEKELYWKDTENLHQLDLSIAPYPGAIYTLKITTRDNNSVSYPITLLPAPENFAYPEFKDLNPPTHNLSDLMNQKFITGKVYIPLFVEKTTSPPFISTSVNNAYYQINCKWTEQPQVGQYISFRCDIPPEIISLPYASLGSIVRGGPDLGGTYALVWWPFN